MKTNTKTTKSAASQAIKAATTDHAKAVKSLKAPAGHAMLTITDLSKRAGHEVDAANARIAEKVAETVKRPETISSVARRLINSGKTNEQVLEELAKQFKPAEDFAIGGKKRHYACWYRSALARAGELNVHIEPRRTFTSNFVKQIDRLVQRPRRNR